MRFEVETGRVSAAVTRARELLADISSERGQMFQAIEELNGMWAGEAHDVFVAQCAADNESMMALVSELQTIVEKISAARQTYETCESNAVEMVASLQV